MNTQILIILGVLCFASFLISKVSNWYSSLPYFTRQKVMYVFVAFVSIASIVLYFGNFLDSNEREVNEIPLVFRGIWIDEFNEFKLIINRQSIVYIDPNGIDKRKPEIESMYLTKRKSCSDCYLKGLKINYNDDFREDYIYLENFHPETEKFNKLKIVPYVLDSPYDDTRSYREAEIWKRSLTDKG